MTLPLPENIDSSYVDDGGDPSVQLHQEHHDEIHRHVNAAIGVGDQLYVYSDFYAGNDFDWQKTIVNNELPSINPFDAVQRAEVDDDMDGGTSMEWNLTTLGADILADGIYDVQIDMTYNDLYAGGQSFTAGKFTAAVTHLRGGSSIGGEVSPGLTPGMWYESGATWAIEARLLGPAVALAGDTLAPRLSLRGNTEDIVITNFGLLITRIG